MTAGPSDKGCPSPGGTKLAQEGEEGTAKCLLPGPSPGPAVDRTKQASLSAVATTSYPVEGLWAHCWKTGPQPSARDSTGPE